MFESVLAANVMASDVTIAMRVWDGSLEFISRQERRLFGA